MSVTVNYTAPTIDYAEQENPVRSPRESHDGTRFNVTRTLECRWRDRLTLMDQLLRAYAITDSNTNRTFYVGDKYPHRAQCYVKSISNIRGRGPGAAVNGDSFYEVAVLTVEYEEREFNPDAESSSAGAPGIGAYKIFEENLDISTEALAIPAAGKLFWANGDPIEDADAPLRHLSNLRWSVQWTELAPVSTALITLAGKCNDAALTSPTLGLEFPAETLYYRGAQINHTIFSNGQSIANVTAVFLKREIEWNKFFQPGVQAETTIHNAKPPAGGNVFKPITPGDFTQLQINA